MKAPESSKDRGGGLYPPSQPLVLHFGMAVKNRRHVSKPYRTTRAPPPEICFSTSLRVAIEVSPGVVEANAP